MNSRTSRRLSAPRSSRAARAAAVANPASLFADSGSPAAEKFAGLSWIHDGVRHRVSLWPEVVFEHETVPGGWEVADPSPAALASATLGVTAAGWRRYGEFVPEAEREFLRQFAFGRMAALLVLVRCPALAAGLRAVPALTGFVAAHQELRGGTVAAWAEAEAVFEREGMFGVLQWLGLPASRQTVRILRCISDPDLPLRLLSPLRSALWEPEVTVALAQAPALSDEQLARACHALAA
jgi:hypothetical protein